MTLLCQGDGSHDIFFLESDREVSLCHRDGSYDIFLLRLDRETVEWERLVCQKNRPLDIFDRGVIMYNPFWNLKEQKKVLLAAHRGCYGGNIPCNSLPAFQIALNYGVDIIELDVESSRDGKLFVLHPNMERVHLRIQDSIREYDSSFVSQLKLSNSDMKPTEYPIVRLEEVLDLLRGKCLINIDKFWSNPVQIAAMIRERGMEDQILVKAKLDTMDIATIEELAYGLCFMPIVEEEDNGFEFFAGRKIRYVGAEVWFTSDMSPVAQPEYIEKMHEAEKIIWVNAVVFSYKRMLAAGHTDDVSILGNPEQGWGWLADRGFDIIQTDWLMQCDAFLKQTGRRK